MTEESLPELLSSIVLFKLIVALGGPDDDTGALEEERKSIAEEVICFVPVA